jgi:trans-aconitate methyltransferase
MDLGFRGEVAELYQNYRRGYPPTVIAALIDAFGLDTTDLVVDLGCGTGQLGIPLARHVRAVLGVDPEPDMLHRARRTSEELEVANICWMVGADSDVPTLDALLGSRSVGAITIGQALHWMDHATLFTSAAPLLRPGGGIAVVTNGIPLWLQDSPWSRALRGFLQEWFATSAQRSCGSDAESQRRYAESMSSAGMAITESVVEYADELTLEQVIGGVYSALSVDQLPPAERRPAFAQQVTEALAPHAPFVEQVPVRLLIGRAEE